MSTRTGASGAGGSGKGPNEGEDDDEDDDEDEDTELGSSAAAAKSSGLGGLAGLKSLLLAMPERLSTIGGFTDNASRLGLGKRSV